MDDKQDYLNEQNDNGLNTPEEKKQLSRKARLIIGIGASVIILALGLSVSFLMQSGETKTLTLTVFSNNWSEVTLKPGVETPLNEYLASGSTAPGYPLHVACSGADDIKLKVDAGTLYTWSAPDYVADSKGSKYSAASDDTVYWSPLDKGDALVPQCTLTITAQKGDADIDEMRLIIRQTGESAYSITLLASE